MPQSRYRALLGALLAVGLAGCKQPEPARPAKPALTVTVTSPAPGVAQDRHAAYGGIFAWQEAGAAAETGGLKLLSLRAEVGDYVTKGQILAELNADMVKAELAAQEAMLAEAAASLAVARVNADRARKLAPAEAISDQEYRQTLAQEQMASARHAAAQAQVDVQRLRLKFTRVRAPDDGAVISRNGAVGQVIPAGTELFRIIRQGRVEWRGELPAARLAALRPGDKVEFDVAGRPVTGRVRKLSPVLETGSRTGTAYVDMPPGSGLVPGQYLQGTFVGGQRDVLVLPASAVIARDGRRVVMTVDQTSKVVARAVETGPAVGQGGVALLSGVTSSDRVVESGAAFLAEGDSVVVVGGGS